jgi:GWxTD domain-containing protein
MARFFIIICSLILFAACGRQKKAAFKEDQSNIYQPSTQALRPECSVFHLSDSVSQLLIKLNLNEILFNQANPQNLMQSQLRFNYTLIDITDDLLNKTIADSLTTVKNFDKIPGKDVIVVSMNFKASPGRLYNLNIEVYDMLRKAGQKNFVVVDKLTANSPQNFRVVGVNDNMPLFTNFIPFNDSVKIFLKRPSDKLYIKFARDDTPLPPPPFSDQTEPTFNFIADSAWNLPYNVGKVYHFATQGLYFIQTDTTQSEGLFLATSNNSFPLIKDIPPMVPPLEYLTTSEEFRNIMRSDNFKVAIDNFWLKFAGNVAVGREMIRIYYNRMYLSNLYFSSYKQGWKTDRGMIYMVFGPPSYIRKTADTETWEYYIRSEGANLTLNFVRMQTPYSFNHYVMQRSDIFTSFWRAAISSWRKGKVFSLED